MPLTILRPISEPNAAEWDEVGAASAWEAVDPGALLAHDDDTSYCKITTGPGDQDTNDFGMTPIPTEVGGVTSLGALVRWRSPDDSSQTIGIAARMDAVLGTETEATFSASASYANTNVAALPRPGGGSWTVEDLLNPTFMLRVRARTNPPTTDLRVTSVWMLLDWIALSVMVEQQREAATRLLRDRREPKELVTLVHGYEALESELMGPVGFSHADGPTFDGKGWGLKGWERGFGRVRHQVISLGVPRVKSTIVNRRRFQTTFWARWDLTVTGDSDRLDGLPRIDCNGGDKTFTRASDATHEDVGGVIQLLGDGRERITPAGMLIEGARTNLLTQSSFVNGTTGWTLNQNTGTGSFGTDTAKLLFDADVSAQSVKVISTAATHDLDITRDTDSLGATTSYVVSVDWEIDKAATVKFALKNKTTANWLQSNGTWGASRDDISLGTTVGSQQRDLMAFTTEGTASAHELYIIGVGAINTTQYNIYHAQVETDASDGFPSSRIVTEATAVTRIADYYKIDNASTLAQRTWPVDKFTAEMILTPEWNSVDLASDFTLLNLFHDANNGIRIKHHDNGVSNPLRFAYEHAGTTELAQFTSPGFTRGTEVRITIRKTSSSGEHGFTNNTIDIFLDGVKGAVSDTVSADLTEAAASILAIGSGVATEESFCSIKSLVVSPIVFSDEEIAKGIS